MVPTDNFSGQPQVLYQYGTKTILHRTGLEFSHLRELLAGIAKCRKSPHELISVGVEVAVAIAPSNQENIIPDGNVVPVLQRHQYGRLAAVTSSQTLRSLISLGTPCTSAERRFMRMMEIQIVQLCICFRKQGRMVWVVK